MINFLIRLLLFLFSLSAICQIKNGRIEYELQFEEDDNLLNSELGDYYQIAIDNASNVTFVLDYTTKQMAFKPIISGINKTTYTFVAGFSGTMGSYYFTKGETFAINQTESSIIGEFLVETNRKIDWQMSQESKMIDRFLCYKATATIKYNNGYADFEKKLIAWYCPEIPFPFGPKAYGDLPGIILELQEGRVLLGAKKIQLNLDNISVTPPKGKIITEEEYSKLRENRHNQLNEK